MKHAYFLSPSGQDAGLTTVSLGVGRALQRRGVSVAFYKPIAQPHADDDIRERSARYAEVALNQSRAESMPLEEAHTYYRQGRVQELMERVIELYNRATEGFDVVILEGLVTHEGDHAAARLNEAMARTLGADVILVDPFDDCDVQAVQRRLHSAGAAYGGLTNERVVGYILNKAGCLAPDHDLQEWLDYMATLRRELPLAAKGVLQLIGVIPKNPVLGQYRTLDVARLLNAKVLREGDLATRRVSSVHLLARTVPNLLNTFRPGALLLPPADRDDILMAASLASNQGVQLAGVVLTGEGEEMEPDQRILNLCAAAVEKGLPVLQADTNSFRVVSMIDKISSEIPVDDHERLNYTLDFIARHIDTDWMVEERLSSVVEKKLSPPAFRYRLAESARAANKRILLPEGEEPRTITAAIECHKRRIARCVLMGNPEEIRRQADAIGLTLPDVIEIIDPEEVRSSYVPKLVEMRKHKNLTEKIAAETLEDNVYLGTIMLARDEADGLVAGAIHSTANTIRPALQLIKTAPTAKVVSSVFFMCLPDQVLVYGDCAVNPDPNPEELADIAIRSAESAEMFGITPRVAMISYSTGTSGEGEDVDKVREATRLAKAMRPDLLIDGPLQYDAAAIPDIARKKAPDSPVAGRATVFIFPDLNTGNTTYKAVQRSAKVVSVGPMLQGLRKPVNDLSRGALVDDIIYTIALTAVQSVERE